MQSVSEASIGIGRRPASSKESLRIAGPRSFPMQPKTQPLGWDIGYRIWDMGYGIRPSIFHLPSSMGALRVGLSKPATPRLPHKAPNMPRAQSSLPPAPAQPPPSHSEST